jgi:hypothetical protein
MEQGGIAWMDKIGDVRLGVHKKTHQFVIGVETPGGIIPIHLTASDLERLGVEAIRLTGRYAVFDFSAPASVQQSRRRPDGRPMEG